MTSVSSYIGPNELFRLLWSGLLARPAVYAEVKENAESTRLCIAVAILGGAAYGLRLAVDSGSSGALFAIVGLVLVLLQTLFEAAVVWAIGAWVLRRGSRFGEVFRPLALARAPQVLYALLALFAAPGELNALPAIWMLICFTVAIRSALVSGWLAAIAVVVAIGIARELLPWLVEESAFLSI